MFGLFYSQCIIQNYFGFYKNIWPSYKQCIETCVDDKYEDLFLKHMKITLGTFTKYVLLIGCIDKK